MSHRPSRRPVAHPAHALAIAGLLFASLTPGPARADVYPDPWWGPDKALHLSVSTLLASGGYVGAAALGAPRPMRLVWGGAFALTLAVAKELTDLAGLGQPSFKDLAWDAVGTALGLVITWAIDVLFFGPAEAARVAPGAWNVRADLPLQAAA